MIKQRLSVRFGLVVGLLLASAGASGSPLLPRMESGGYGNLNWQARSQIVGVTSSATLSAGGNSLFFAPMPQYSGVVTLIMNFGTTASICSGTLMPDRVSIVTAAHCVSEGTAARPISTTAYFYGGSNPDTVVWSDPASTAIPVASYIVHPDYSGEVIDQNDIAVLKLSSAAPGFATSYQLHSGTDLTGQNFNVAGYGMRSNAGGSVGSNLGVGRLRQGDNRYDFRLGDADFGGLWSTILGDPAERIAYAYLADFDDGSAARDASCLVAADFALSGAKFCHQGVGASEAAIAGGDSGGPGFIDGKLASVNSFGITFRSDFGDLDDAFNTTFGELSGYVPISIHENFLYWAMVPAPGGLGLAGIGLFSLLAMRRRRSGALQ